MSYFYRGAAVALCALSLAACSDMSERDQRTLSGGAIGAGAGALGGALIGGSPVAGAALGAVGGAVIGNVTTPQH